MDKKMREALPEEKNAARGFYRALMKGIDTGVAWQKYGISLGLPRAAGMMNRYKRGGAPALEAYVIELSQGEDSERRRQANIMLQDSAETDSSTGTLLSDVTPQEVPWLWYPRLHHQSQLSR